MIFERGRRYRHISRYREIAEVLIKHGFGYIIQQLDLQQYIPLQDRILKGERRAGSRQPPARRFRIVLEELGPTFVKLGQMMSTRPDLVPESLLEELEKLQDDVTPVDYSGIRDVLAAEMGEDWETRFTDFSRTPLAAASIGQVYTATTREGERLVIKVQRPNIEQRMQADLDIMFNLAHLVEERTRIGQTYHPVELIEEFSRILSFELDYRIEGRNAERFRHNFAQNPRVVIPEIRWELTTKRVLAMERIDGLRLSRLISSEVDSQRLGVTRREIASLGARVFLEQVLIHGFFHGDLHPGNIFIMSGGRLGFIDFGIVGRLQEDKRRQLAGLFISVTAEDVDELIEELIRLGFLSGGVDRHEVREDLQMFLERYYGLPLREIHVGEVMREFVSLAGRHQITIPRDLILLTKALLTIEGVGKDLDPDFNALEEARPFARRLVINQLAPGNIFRRLFRDSGRQLELLLELPGLIHRILEQARDDDLRLIEIDLRLEKLVSKLDIVTNRLSISFIVSAIIIASALVMVMERGPFLWGFPALGIMGFLLAFLFGFLLIISIIRSGRF